MSERVIRCTQCGAEKKVTRFWAKYCSPKCKMIAWAMKQKEAKK